MAVFELLADLAIIFGKESFKKHLSTIFMGYLTNTAASVRDMGVEKSGVLAKTFKEEWIMNEFIPVVINHYTVDKKGYNYRMCCLQSLAAVMPYVMKDKITQHIVPIYEKGCKDDIPNVKFCVSKIIIKNKEFIDQSVYMSKIVPHLKEMATDSDKDVAYFA